MDLLQLLKWILSLLLKFADQYIFRHEVFLVIVPIMTIASIISLYPLYKPYKRKQDKALNLSDLAELVVSIYFWILILYVALSWWFNSDFRIQLKHLPTLLPLLPHFHYIHYRDAKREYQENKLQPLQIKIKKIVARNGLIILIGISIPVIVSLITDKDSIASWLFMSFIIGYLYYLVESFIVWAVLTLEMNDIKKED